MYMNYVPEALISVYFLSQIASSSTHTKRTKKYKAPSTASAIDKLDVRSSLSSGQEDPTTMLIDDNQGRDDINTGNSHISDKRYFETALRQGRRKTGLDLVVGEDLQASRVPSALMTASDQKYSSSSKCATLCACACLAHLPLLLAERTNNRSSMVDGINI